MKIIYRRLVKIIHRKYHIPTPIPPRAKVTQMLIPRNPRPSTHRRQGSSILIPRILPIHQRGEINASILLAAPCSRPKVFPKQEGGGAVEDVRIGRLGVVLLAEEVYVRHSFVLACECVDYVGASFVGFGYGYDFLAVVAAVVVPVSASRIIMRDEFESIVDDSSRGNDELILILVFVFSLFDRSASITISHIRFLPCLGLLSLSLLGCLLCLTLTFLGCICTRVVRLYDATTSSPAPEVKSTPIHSRRYLRYIIRRRGCHRYRMVNTISTEQRPDGEKSNQCRQLKGLVRSYGSHRVMAVFSILIGEVECAAAIIVRREGRWCYQR
mmetsp:Transcript_16008/g.33845  ORF Transcript_16008/g.33845 Transcript_16008/m.33845 type:complete len:327 (+) Transcript_16008:1269-2249(+)